MRTIIAGSRDITDSYSLFVALDDLFAGRKITEVVSGGARGVDRIGEDWAAKHSLPIKQFIPDWHPEGFGFNKAAGHQRNADMAKYADCLVAFWDGESRGTKSMIDLALKHKLEVHVFTKKPS